MNRRQAKKAESKYWMTKEEEFRLWYGLKVWHPYPLPPNRRKNPHPWPRWRQWLNAFWKRQRVELWKWKHLDIPPEVQFYVINDVAVLCDQSN